MMIEKIKENLGGILLIAAILTIGTCNVILNTNREAEIYDNPKPGDYYVFNGFLSETGDQIFKIKTVKADSILFYIPQSELVLGFKPNKSESAIREADQKGQMYGVQTVQLSKTTIAAMKANDGLSKRLNGAKGRLEFVFR
jgi:hypothetical protein